MTPADKTAAAAVRKLLPKIPDTADEMREVVAEAAQTSYKIDTLEARKSADIAAVNKVYGGEIATLSKKLGNLVGGIKAWATKHRDQFGDKQRLLVDDHALRFQRSPGALHHADKADEQVDAILATGDEELIAAAIAIKPAPDKNSIKAAIDSCDALLAQGYEIVDGDLIGGSRALDEDESDAIQTAIELGLRFKSLGYQVKKPETFSFDPASHKTDTAVLKS